MFVRFVTGVLTLVFSIFVYYAIQPTDVTFTIEHFIPREPLSVFDFVKNLSNLVDISYSIKHVELHDCRSEDYGRTKKCQFTAEQDFIHVGRQKVQVNFLSFARNLTIQSNMVIFYGFILVQTQYTFKAISDFFDDGSGVSGTLLQERCTITSPQLLHRYANKTIHDTHVAMLSNVEYVMAVESTDEDEYY